VDVVEAQRGSRELEDAAQIWAEATAMRDGASEVACLADSLPIIEAVLDRSSRAFVLLARTDGGAAAGFAAVEPITAGQTVGTTGPRAEVSYLGVRAVALYERLGWESVGVPTPHQRTGKPEQRYELALKPRP
jgi:hypothetical protein